MLGPVYSSVLAASADYQGALTLQVQAASQAHKQRAQRSKLMLDTQTRIFEIQQEVVVQRARASDKIYEKWQQYLGH